MKFQLAVAVAAGALLAACGGGGNSTQLGTSNVFTVSPVATAAPTATPVSGPVNVSGSVVSIPAGTYGLGAAQTPLAGAIVVIGPTLVTGATAPPVAPGGDVVVTTSATGAYSATITTGPAAPISTQAIYVRSPNDLSGFTAPASGYYISVFPAGSDGASAGKPLPVHAFSGVGTGGVLTTQRVTVASTDEANFLTLVNHDRTTANPIALPMIFDEYAQEAARLHVNEENAGNFYCHYNAANVGPGSRYLALGALAQVDESIGKTSGLDAPGAYALVEAQFIAEAPVNGGHYTNIIDSTHAWAGVAVLVGGPTAQYVDQEFVSPNGISPFTYPNFSGSQCPAGVTPNNS